MVTTKPRPSPPRTIDHARKQPFIPEPRRINLLLRPLNTLADWNMHQRFVPGRLLAWDARTAFSSVVSSLHLILPPEKTRKGLGVRLLNLVAVTAAYTVNSPYCIADTVESEPTGLSEAELEVVRAGGDVAALSSFSARERLAVQYARMISSTPLEFPEDLIAELTAAFTEREIVIMAALAAEINRNGRLIEALGAPPPVYPAATD